MLYKRELSTLNKELISNVPGTNSSPLNFSNLWTQIFSFDKI